MLHRLRGTAGVDDPANVERAGKRVATLENPRHDIDRVRLASTDDELIAFGAFLKQAGGQEVVLVTRDLNLQIKARRGGLDAVWIPDRYLKESRPPTTDCVGGRSGRSRVPPTSRRSCTSVVPDRRGPPSGRQRRYPPRMWEYTVYNFISAGGQAWTWQVPPGESVVPEIEGNQSLGQGLAHFGSRGWELVSMAPVSSQYFSSFTLVFKRPGPQGLGG